MKVKIFSLTVLFFLVMVVVTNAQEKTNNSIDINAVNEAMQQQLQGFNLNGYTNNGEKSWEVNGDKADISDDKIKVTNKFRANIVTFEIPHPILKGTECILHYQNIQIYKYMEGG